VHVSLTLICALESLRYAKRRGAKECLTDPHVCTGIIKVFLSEEVRKSVSLILMCALESSRYIKNEEVD
jgi:hypothetical protein